MVNFTPRPLYLLERTQVATEKEAGWASEGHSEKRKSLVLPIFETRFVQPIV
jgi:hypothetical protein